jgi:hypothetical protein
LETLVSLQKIICSLSLVNEEEEAMSIISKYYGHILIRFLAINRVSRNSGDTAGTDGKILISNNDKYRMLRDTSLSNFKRAVPMEILKVEIPKKEGKMRQLGISSTYDRVLQRVQCYCWIHFMKPNLTLICTVLDVDELH